MNEAFTGSIVLFAGDFAPRNWAFCDGQLLSINNNTALFALLGAAYGGDGRTTFALPKLSPINGVNFIICLNGIFPPRD